MKIRSTQAGVGLIEVLVALLLLGIGVLGFAGLQLKALKSTDEASTRVQAIILAQDLTERIRANPEQIAVYATRLNAISPLITDTQSCFGASTKVTAATMAGCDSAQVIERSQHYGMKVSMPLCSGNSNSRRCIYVAWGDTNPTEGDDANDCTKNGIYKPKAACVVLESY